MAKSKSKPAAKPRSRKKRDPFRWGRILTPILFGSYLVARVVWLDKNSDSNWWTYLLVENGFVASLGFAVLMVLLSIRRLKFVLLWIGIVAATIGINGHPTFGHRGEAAGRSLKVLTYNVAHFDLDQPGVIDVLRESQADLIFLQEACLVEKQKEVGANLCRELKGYQFVSASSNMILSKHPIKLERNLNVPTKWPTKEFPIAIVQSPVGPIRVCCVHLEPSWVGGFPPNFSEYVPVVSKVVDDRRAQVDILLAAMRPSKVPVIIAGDCNGTPGSEAINRLGEFFTDSYASTERGFGMTLLPQYPYKRIDYVWSRGLKPLQTEVVSSHASDHMPVLTELGK